MPLLFDLDDLPVSKRDPVAPRACDSLVRELIGIGGVALAARVAGPEQQELRVVRNGQRAHRVIVVDDVDVVRNRDFVPMRSGRPVGRLSVEELGLVEDDRPGRAVEVDRPDVPELAAVPVSGPCIAKKAASAMMGSVTAAMRSTKRFMDGIVPRVRHGELAGG